MCEGCQDILRSNQFGKRFQELWLLGASVCYTCKTCSRTDDAPDASLSDENDLDVIVENYKCTGCCQLWPEYYFKSMDVRHYLEMEDSTKLLCHRCQWIQQEPKGFSRLGKLTCSRCDRSMTLHEFSPSDAMNIVAGGTMKKRQLDRMACVSCRFPLCVMCTKEGRETRSTKAQNATNMHRDGSTGELAWHCCACKYPPCAGVGCFKPRPKDRRFTAWLMPNWTCVDCADHVVRKGSVCQGRLVGSVYVGGCRKEGSKKANDQACLCLEHKFPTCARQGCKATRPLCKDKKYYDPRYAVWHVEVWLCARHRCALALFKQLVARNVLDWLRAHLPAIVLLWILSRNQ